MSKVYIVFMDRDYEFSYLQKVFSSKEKAIKYIENECNEELRLQECEVE